MVFFQEKLKWGSSLTHYSNKIEMYFLKNIVHHWSDGSLGNLLQCQSLDIPHTMMTNNWVGVSHSSCNDQASCFCKRCSTHWEKYIKLTLQCPHKGTGTLATCDHFPPAPRSTPADFPPARDIKLTPCDDTRDKMIQNSAKLAVSKQELSPRVQTKESKEYRSDKRNALPVAKEVKLDQDNSPDVETKKRPPISKPSTVHTVPLSSYPTERLQSTPLVSTNHTEDYVSAIEGPKDRLHTEATSTTKSKRHMSKSLRERLDIHRRQHALESKTSSASGARRKLSREWSKNKKMIKKKIKDSDNYMLEQGKIIKRKGSLCRSFSGVASASLFDAVVFSRDDDVFEKTVADERRAEFFGSDSDSEHGSNEAHSSDSALVKEHNYHQEELDSAMCLQLSKSLSVERLEALEKSGEAAYALGEPKALSISGNNNLFYASSASPDSSRIKTSHLSLGSKEFLSMKSAKQHKPTRSYSLTKSKEHRKKRAKRPKFRGTSESEEFVAETYTDNENDATPVHSNTGSADERKKKKRGKKTPLEFEKRLIAGTRRYYISKMEKMKSKVNLLEIDGSALDVQEEKDSRANSPVSLVSLPPHTCDTPQNFSSRSESLNKPSPAGTYLPDNRQTVYSISTPYKTDSSCTNTPGHSACIASRPPSTVISVARLKNVRVGPSIKERFCNSLVFLEKPSKIERSRYTNNENNSHFPYPNDGFGLQMKVSRMKLHRELELEEELTPLLTPAWTFSYVPPIKDSYSCYINNMQIQTSQHSNVNFS